MVTGRVTDASRRRRSRRSRTTAGRPTAYDALAGAVVAGHVIECGTQATGGNFSGFRDAPARRDRRSASRSPRSPPTARRVITKHAGTGGAVTVDTVTAQLVYEIQTTRYLGPDVTTHLDTIELAQAGPDRVADHRRPRRARRPRQLKVCVNELGGFRNSVEFVLTGLDIEAKAAWVRAQVDARARRPAAGDASRWSTASAARTPTPTPRRPRPCLLRVHGPGPVAPTPVGKRVHRAPRSSWRWRPTPASR